MNQSKLQKSLLLFSAKLANILTFEELAQTVEKILEETLPVTHTTLYLMDPETEKLRLFYAKNFSDLERKDAERTVMNRHPGKVFLSGETIYIPDTQFDKNKTTVDSPNRHFTVRSRLYIPIKSKNKVIGSLGAVSTVPNCFKEKDLETLTIIGNIAGAVYENILNVKKIKQSTDDILSISKLPEENPNPVIRINFSGKVIYANQAAKKICKVMCTDIAELFGRDLEEIINKAKSNTKKIVKIIHRNNKYFHFTFHPSIANQYINCYGEDLTEQKAAELHNQKLANILEKTDNAIVITNLNGNVDWVNRGFLKMTGYTYNEIINKPAQHLLTGEETNKETLQLIVDTILKKESLTCDILHYKKDGSSFWANVYFEPVINNEGIITDVISIHKDITEEKNLQFEIQKANRLFDEVIKTSNDGFGYWDIIEDYFYFSPRWKRMFGYEDHEIPSNMDTFFMLVYPPDKRLSQITMEKLFKGKMDNFSIALRFLHKNGKLIYVNTRGSITRNENGENLRFIGSTTDITEMVNKNIQLETEKKIAENASKSKEQFLSNMSHEIRTPLNSINGLAELLKHTSLSSEQDKYADGIVTSSHHLLKILNNILDYNKIATGRMDVEEINFDLKKELEDILSTFKHIAEEKNIYLGINFNPEISKYVLSDQVKIKQILVNLLANALKFTHKGSVTLHCSLVEKVNEKQKILIEVKDTGIGINPKNRNLIFESFMQANDSVARQFGGSGLGLAISQELAKILGSEIKIDSQEGKGSNFNFTLEFKIGNPLIQEDRKIEIDPEKLKGKKILVAEDYIPNQFIVETFLKLWNAESVIANNGQEVITLMEKEKFDLILMDKHMPVLDGLETTKIIRQKVDKKIPIIGLSATVVSSVIQECLDAGMNDYIAKPFDPNRLYKVILSNLNIEHENILPEIVENVTTQNKVLYNIDRLRKTLNNDEEKIKEMIELFLSSTEQELHDLKNATKNMDTDTIAMVLHKTKGMAGMLGMDQLVIFMKDGELIAKTTPDSKELPDLLTKIIALLEASRNALKKEIS